MPSGPSVSPARSPILLIACCREPASAAFKAFSVAALASATSGDIACLSALRLTIASSVSLRADKQAGAVRIAEATSRISPDAPLLVGEGIETTLSAMVLSGYQGVSAIDAGNFASVWLPPCSEIIVLKDRDNGGHKAVEGVTHATALRKPSASPYRRRAPLPSVP